MTIAVIGATDHVGREIVRGAMLADFLQEHRADLGFTRAWDRKAKPRFGTR